MRFSINVVPAYIVNDGKQTPMRGHPVFIAQHATATCCRKCIRTWHKMQPEKELSQVQQEYLVDVIMTWIQKEMENELKFPETLRNHGNQVKFINV